MRIRPSLLLILLTLIVYVLLPPATTNGWSDPGRSSKLIRLSNPSSAPTAALQSNGAVEPPLKDRLGFEHHQ